MNQCEKKAVGGEKKKGVFQKRKGREGKTRGGKKKSFPGETGGFLIQVGEAGKKKKIQKKGGKFLLHGKGFREVESKKGSKGG